MPKQTRMLLSTGGELDCPPRFGTPRNYDRRTLGAEVAYIASLLGRQLMPWQQWVADVALELNDDGTLAYNEIDLAAMRRAGKTDLLLAVAVHRCRSFAKILDAPQKVTYTAQDGKHARRKWEEDQVERLDRSTYGPLGRARDRGKHARVKFDNNDPGIFWNNKSSIRPVAPTEAGGHGGDADLAFIDEAFAHADDRVEQAYGPAMLTRVSPQLWVTSAAGTDKSAYWWQKVTAGRAMCEAKRFDGPVAYFEWSAANDEPYDNPDTWWQRIPAMGHTVNEAAVRRELLKVQQGEAVAADDEGAGDQGLERFLRPYLGVWCRIPQTDKRRAVIAPGEWQGCREKSSQLVDPVAFAVEVTSDRSLAVIGVAGPSSAAGRCHVELVDTRLGVDWVVDRLVELRDRWSSVGVGVRTNGEAGSLVPALERAGLTVHELGGRHWPRACADFVDAVTAKSLVHIGQDNLDGSVAAGVRRELPGGGFEWDRRQGSVEVAGLQCVTVARWVATTVQPEPVAAGSTFYFPDLED